MALLYYGTWGNLSLCMYTNRQQHTRGPLECQLSLLLGWHHHITPLLYAASHHCLYWLASQGNDMNVLLLSIKDSRDKAYAIFVSFMWSMKPVTCTFTNSLHHQLYIQYTANILYDFCTFWLLVTCETVPFWTVCHLQYRVYSQDMACAITSFFLVICYDMSGKELVHCMVISPMTLFLPSWSK